MYIRVFSPRAPGAGPVDELINDRKVCRVGKHLHGTMCAAIDLDAAQVNGELVTPVRGRFGTQSGQSGSMSAKLTTRSPSNGSGASGGNGGVNSGPSEYRQPRWKPSVFDFKKSGGVCPTCQGSGRIPKGTEREREGRGRGENLASVSLLLGAWFVIVNLRKVKYLWS